jgi:hypothetical protein
MRRLGVLSINIFCAFGNLVAKQALFRPPLIIQRPFLKISKKKSPRKILKILIKISCETASMSLG